MLVCHLGSVRFFWFHPARRIDEYLRAHPDAGRTPDARYHALLQKSLTKLWQRLPPFWAQVKTSVNEILDYARAKGVKLGFENREKFEELPLDEDYAAFIESFDADAPIGYWHDTGHADLKESMGLLRHDAHLARMAGRTLGFHLHDVNEQGHDHQAIGAGRVDFKMVSRFWRPEHLLTLEFSRRIPVEHVRASKRRIEELMS